MAAAVTRIVVPYAIGSLLLTTLVVVGGCYNRHYENESKSSDIPIARTVAREILTVTPNEIQTETSMAQINTYTGRYGGPRHSSATSALTSATGVVSWSAELGFTAPVTAPELLTWNDRIVVGSAQDLALFEPNGQLGWHHQKRREAPVAFRESTLYYATKTGYLMGVGVGGETLLEKAPFPGLHTNEYDLIMLYPREDDFVAASYLAEPLYDEEDAEAEPVQPEVAGRRVSYGSRNVKWSGTFGGELRLPVLFVPEMNHWIMAQDKIVIINIEEGKEVSRFDIPLERVVNWSAAADGTLLINGYDKNRAVLLAVSLDGTEKWRWTGSEEVERWSTDQPSIQGAGDVIYALMQGRLLAIRGGELAWEFDIRNLQPSASVDEGKLPLATSLRRGTTLGDGSLLVTVGNRLLHIDKTGQIIFTAQVGGEILGSPVVDTNGNIYVVTTTKLICIQ